MTLRPIVCTLLILVAAVDSSPGASDCAKISATFKAIVAAVADADSAYRSCVAASRGRDDCTAEYGDLDLATARFKAMVRDYLKACRQGGGRP